MSLLQGHPILAEIRQGFKLRPTTTVDKSKPTILAEGEEPVVIKYERKTPPPVLYIPQPKAQSKSICRVPKEALNIQHNARGASPSASKPHRVSTNTVTKPSLLKLGGEITDRGALLNSIKGGIKLRKTVTNDKSGLILDDEYYAEKGINRDGSALSTMTITPGSSLSGSRETLDSQGYSSLSPPSATDDNSSINSRFSDSETESTPVPQSPPLVPVSISKSAPPPPPPPPMGNAAFKAAPMASAPPPPPPPPVARVPPPPPPPPLPAASKATSVASAPPPPPPPPPPASTSSLKPRETQEIVETFDESEDEDPRCYRPSALAPPEPPKKSDVVFDEANLKVSREEVQAEIPKGSAAARIAAFAKMGGSEAPKLPVSHFRGPSMREWKKKEPEASVKAESKPVESGIKEEKKLSSSTTKKPTSETVSESKTETKKVSTADVKKALLYGDSEIKKTSTKSKDSVAKKTDAKKEHSSKVSETKKDSSKVDESKRDMPSKTKDSKKTESTSSTTKKVTSSKPKSTSPAKKPSATIQSSATKYSLPITVKTDLDPPAPPLPNSSPPKSNTGLGPYRYQGPKASPGAISTGSSAYHTAASSTTSSYSSVPEASPSLSTASTSASPRSTASADSAKENGSENGFGRSKGATQHSRNFDKIRQSFGAGGSTPSDSNNNGDRRVGTLRKSPLPDATTSKSNSVSINTPWNKKDDNDDVSPGSSRRGSSTISGLSNVRGKAATFEKIVI